MLRVLALTAAVFAFGAAAAQATSIHRLFAFKAHRAIVATATVTLVTIDGQPLGGIFQQWADQAKVATVPGKLIFVPNGCAPAGSSATGCSTGPVPPWTTDLTLGKLTYFWSAASDRSSFYFELGHQFDWQLLSDSDRAYLAQLWGAPQAPWWDTAASLQRGSEDGLEADFAAAYRSCAEGQSFDSLSFVGPPAIANARAAATCALVDRVARAHAHLA